MEVFADCFSAAFREQVYAKVEEMQEFLGLANDSHVAVKRLGDLGEWIATTLPAQWKRFKPGFDYLRHMHEKRLPDERQKFLDWWQEWRTSGGESELFSLIQT